MDSRRRSFRRAPASVDALHANPALGAPWPSLVKRSVRCLLAQRSTLLLRHTRLRPGCLYHVVDCCACVQLRPSSAPLPALAATATTSWNNCSFSPAHRACREYHTSPDQLTTTAPHLTAPHRTSPHLTALHFTSPHFPSPHCPAASTRPTVVSPAPRCSSPSAICAKHDALLECRRSGPVHSPSERPRTWRVPGSQPHHSAATGHTCLLPPREPLAGPSRHFPLRRGPRHKDADLACHCLHTTLHRLAGRALPLDIGRTR